jgi:hypothetical protein
VNASLGNWLILFGLVLAVLGLAFKAGLLDWFCSLPGDIRFKRDGFQLYFPITTMIVVSVVMSLGYAVLRKFF